MVVHVIYFDSPHHEPMMYKERDEAVGVAGEHWCAHEHAKVRVLRFNTTVYRTLAECRDAMDQHMPWTSVHGYLIWKDGRPIE